MKNPTVSINDLNTYITHNEVIYQACGELVELSNDDNQENRQTLLTYLTQASSVEVYEKGDSFIHEPFEELDDWATETDYLLLLQIIGVLICIPKDSAIEAKIVNL